MTEDKASYGSDRIDDMIKDKQEFAKLVQVVGDDIVIDVKTIMEHMHPGQTVASQGYAIPLDRAKDYGEIIGWVHHLCEKTWMTPRLIRRFIDVALKANDLTLPYS
jgi:hypothetical protein